MYKIHFTFLFLFAVSISFSQKNEIGISILNYVANKDDSSISDTSGYSKLKSLNSLQPVLTFNHINTKNIDLYIQAGYFYTTGNGSNKSTNQSNGLTVYSHSQNAGQSVFFKLGIAKRYYYDKLILSVGVNIPFEYQYYKLLKSDAYYYDKSGTLLEYDQTRDQPAQKYVTGINIHQSIYYNLFKDFYIGLDLNLGFLTSITNGTRKYTSSLTSYQNSVYLTSTSDIKTKFAYTNSLNFQPVIGIRYVLPQKK